MRPFHSLPIILTASMFGLSGNGQAQTYFYIDQIAVMPAAPTDQDNVQLVLSGNLSSSDAHVDTAFATVNGLAITLTVNASTSGGIGFPVLVPHTESMDLGQLPAGTYTIAIAGSGMDDSAPAPQHSFTVASGGLPACDSLVIAGVSWEPFSDTTLLVHVYNPTSELFDYPGFVLLDANGDTLAKETVNFFGIGQESWHLLTVHPGAVVPEGPFSGTLELWKLFYGTFACSWNMSFDLCPPAPCAMLSPMVQNTGGGLALGNFPYTIRQDGNVVATGELTLTADAQYASDSICLPPGNYLMEMTADEAPGGQVYFGVSVDGVMQGPTAPLIVTTLSAVAFQFYGPCADGTQAIIELPSAQLAVAQSADGISVSHPDGGALGELVIYDGQGRLIMHTHESASRHSFNTAAWASGLYVLQARNTGGQVLMARWAKEN